MTRGEWQHSMMHSDSAGNKRRRDFIGGDLMFPVVITPILRPQPTKPRPLDDDVAISIQHAGFLFAKDLTAQGRGFFPGVNACPFGAAQPGAGNLHGEAWYVGFWTWFYVFLPWVKASKHRFQQNWETKDRACVVCGWSFSHPIHEVSQ